MNRSLLVPHFARLTDYFGLWSIFPPAAASLWQAARRIDLAWHVRAAIPKRALDTPMELVPTGTSGESIAVIRAIGPLMKQQPSFSGTSTISIRRAIRQAAADPSVSSILMAIDSPGGTVAGTADLAADVKAARRKKTVWAHIDDMGASAAYWIASQASQVFANDPTALVGSIGTILSVTDTTGRDDREGVRTMNFATGPLKAVGQDGVPITEEASNYLQSLVNQIQVSFDEAVMKGRRMSATKLAAVKSGEIFTAPRAQELGLIDGIRSLDSTLEALTSIR